MLYKVAACEHVYSKKQLDEVTILSYFERGGLEKQQRGPSCS